MIAAIAIFIQCKNDDDGPEVTLIIPPPVELNLNPALVEQGKETFRFDTFGDEAFWSGVLELDKAVLGDANGGFGPGLSPNTALAVGLKVDAEALPQSIVDAINAGQVDLDDPATTLALLQLNAVVGVKGNFDQDDNLVSMGITCALCHSTVDDSFAPGIGSRLDGWPNRDLNVGAIIGITKNDPIADILGVDVATLNSVLNAWGPGHFSAALLLDGKATKPDGTPATLVIPPAFGLQAVDHATATGWGDITYWNRLVAVLEMGGQGNFSDPRLNNADQFPIAVARGSFDVMVDEDLVGPKLEALLEYQLSLLPPTPDPGSFDESDAIRGKALFEGQAQCATCHPAPVFADNILHDPEEIGIDSFEADRSPTGKYRTPPLRALFVKAKGGYFHDGRFGTLEEVVAHYNDHFDLNLSASEQQDLVEYLKAL
ncbi:hypothetical protein GWK08_12975 [Leptobacterium flavescens]|uniref:Cytochrome c domain-containing protein n=2 Tax=Leptobacterium flavescens TaxID=472055 RepID=A0A6P0URF6_9FLAO|nr:hypothetical protein [Leptobacterium flavescens]